MATSAGAPEAARTGSERHRVSVGENLTTIARRYGLSLDELRGANPEVVTDRIDAGAWLVIPRAQEAGGG
jgi:hypothetical protein